MNIWDHFGELRRRLLICISVLLGGLVAGVLAIKPVIGWLARPVGVLVFTQPTEAFAAQAKVAVGVSFLLGLPVFLYQAWAFVASGLQESEKRYLRWAVPLSYIFFMVGLAFSTFVVFPRSLAFLTSLRSSDLEPMLTVASCLDLFILLGLVFGLMLELPIVLHFLARMGILRADFLEHNRRVTYLAIFIFASIFNMSPDVFTQLLLAAAGIALFEISILLIRWETKPK
jgi:sec-independent protein translocase protein TatC